MNSIYEEHYCQECQVHLTRQRGNPDPWICSACIARSRLHLFTDAEITVIRSYFHEGRPIEAIRVARQIANLSLKDAIDIVNVLVVENY